MTDAEFKRSSQHSETRTFAKTCGVHSSIRYFEATGVVQTFGRSSRRATVSFGNLRAMPAGRFYL